jgi:hypothetical protein
VLKIIDILCDSKIQKIEMKDKASVNRRQFVKTGLGFTLGMTGLTLHACKTSSTPNNAKWIEPKSLNPLGIFLANHNQDTGLIEWDIERWKIEITNLKRMGARAIWYLPMQFGQRSQKDFDPGSTHWQLQQDICQAIVDAGLEVGIYIGYNDVFPEMFRKHPDLQAEYGKYGMEQAHFCPSIPAALDIIQSLRDKVFRDLPQIDYMISPISDYGGCSCIKCAPLPKTYVEVMKAQSDLCRKYHPQARIVTAGHGINLKEEDLLRQLLAKSDWVDFVAEIPRGVKPILKYYMYPEITMVGGWGRLGPCPILGNIRKAYREEYPYISASVTYSEGVHDDVNQFAVLQFAQNPNRTVKEVAQQYAEEWLNLGSTDAKQIAEVISGLGSEMLENRNYVDPNAGVDIPRADERIKVLMDVRKSNKTLRDNYHYWLLLYRAVCESFYVTEGPLKIETLYQELENAQQAFNRLEPAYGRHLSNQMVWRRPGYIPWNWPRSFHHAWYRENGFIDK